MDAKSISSRLHAFFPEASSRTAHRPLRQFGGEILKQQKHVLSAAKCRPENSVFNPIYPCDAAGTYIHEVSSCQGVYIGLDTTSAHIHDARSCVIFAPSGMLFGLGESREHNYAVLMSNIYGPSHAQLLMRLNQVPSSTDLGTMRQGPGRRDDIVSQ